MNDLEVLLSGLYPWSYLIVGAGVMIENAGIPVPGETIMVAASILSAAGGLNPYLVLASGAAGAVFGDNIGYWIGRRGGRKLVDRLSRNLPSVKPAINRTELFFKRYGGVTVFFARFITGIRIFAGPVAGVSLMGFKRFFFYNAAGALVWAGTLVFGIMYMGSVYRNYLQDYTYADYVIYGLLFVVLLFIAYKTVQKLRTPDRYK